MMLYIIISVVVAFFIANAIVKSYKAQMTNVVTPGQANEYVVRSSFKVYSQSDKFLYSNVVKIPRDTDNNRGGNHAGGGIRSGGGRPGSGGRPSGGPRGGGGRPGGGPRGGGGGRRR